MDNSKDKQCQVCQQAASVLYILPCYHTLCQGCLQTHGEGDKNITCRVCGAKYGISGDSQTSSVEDIPAKCVVEDYSNSYVLLKSRIFQSKMLFNFKNRV